MARNITSTRALLACVLVGSALACTPEQELTAIPLERVAVASGDFDRLEETLTRNGVSHDLYEGYISQAVYDEEIDPDAISLKSEALFLGLDEAGEPLLYANDAVFVNSGTRGLGAYAYNGVEEDDTLLTDEHLVEHLTGFTGRGRVLVVSDWAYDLVEAAWPDQISFLHEDDGPDGAQIGLNDAVIARVTSSELAVDLGVDQLELVYDFSYWAVMEDVAADVEVYLRGDISYQSPEGAGTLELTDVPLLVGFESGGGQVIYSSFAWKAQKTQVADLLLRHLVEGLVYDGDTTEDSGETTTP